MDLATELTHLPDATDILLERDVQRLGHALHPRLRSKTPASSKRPIAGTDARLAMRDPALKTDLFRLIDALPMLSPANKSRVTPRYLLADGREFPPGFGLALRATENPLAASISAFVIKQNVRRMAGRFIVGEDARTPARS